MTRSAAIVRSSTPESTSKPRRAARRDDAEDPILHIRVPRELVDRIDAVGEAAGNTNRSHVVRALLYQVLTSDPERSNVVQALYDFANERKIIIRRLMGEFARIAPGVAAKVFREATKG